MKICCGACGIRPGAASAARVAGAGNIYRHPVARGGASRRVTLSNALLVHLSQLPWPGNVRQLQSVLKVMLALADEGDTLTPDALPEAYRAAPAPLPRGGLQAHDEQLIVDTLARVNGNVSRAAQILGIARSTLYRRAARAGRPRR